MPGFACIWLNQLASCTRCSSPVHLATLPYSIETAHKIWKLQLCLVAAIVRETYGVSPTSWVATSYYWEQTVLHVFFGQQFLTYTDALIIVDAGMVTPGSGLSGH